MSRPHKKLAILVFMFFSLTCSVSKAFAEGPICEELFSGISPDGKYDFSLALFPGGLEKVASDWPRIFAQGIPVQKQNGKEEVLPLERRSGRMVVASPRYIITQNHITDLFSLIIRRPTPFGIIEIEEKAQEVRNLSYWMQFAKDSPQVPLKKVEELPDIDTAIFEIADPAIFLTPTLPLGRSSELCLGHKVFILGSPALLGTHVSEGVVSAFRLIPPEIYEKKFASSQLNLYITVSTEVEHGDSGSPVVAFRDGRPEIIGTASAVFKMLGLMHGLNLIIPIDEIVERIKSAHDIDLYNLNRDYFKNR